MEYLTCKYHLMCCFCIILHKDWKITIAKYVLRTVVYYFKMFKVISRKYQQNIHNNPRPKKKGQHKMSEPQKKKKQIIKPKRRTGNKSLSLNMEWSSPPVTTKWQTVVTAKTQKIIPCDYLYIWTCFPMPRGGFS